MSFSYTMWADNILQWYIYIWFTTFCDTARPCDYSSSASMLPPRFSLWRFSSFPSKTNVALCWHG